MPTLRQAKDGRWYIRTTVRRKPVTFQVNASGIAFLRTKQIAPDADLSHAMLAEMHRLRFVGTGGTGPGTPLSPPLRAAPHAEVTVPLRATPTTHPVQSGFRPSDEDRLRWAASGLRYGDSAADVEALARAQANAAKLKTPGTPGPSVRDRHRARCVSRFIRARLCSCRVRCNSLREGIDECYGRRRWRHSGLCCH